MEIFDEILIVWLTLGSGLKLVARINEISHSATRLAINFRLDVC